MSLCAQCAFEMNGAFELCPHHCVREADWAATNRIMCDLLHRGRAPARLAPAERDADLLTAA
jgi:hypothetical protein